MNTANNSTITLEQLCEMHLDSLQALFNLSDAAIGAVEILLAVELKHQAINTDHNLEQLREHVLSRMPCTDNHDLGFMTMEYIKELETANTMLGELAVTAHRQQKTADPELASLRASFASLTASFQDMERQRTQAQDQLAAARQENAKLQQAIKDGNDALTMLITAALDATAEEAGTEAKANPTAPAPSAPNTPPLAQTVKPSTPATPAFLPHGEAIATLERSLNGNNGATAVKHDEPPAEPQEQPMTFDWSRLPLVYQSLIRPLEQKEISWKSLSAEQKTKLAVEAASQILAAQPDFPDTTLTHDLFNSLKPDWMTSLQGLAVGVPLQIQELRRLAVNRAQRQAIKNTHESPAPSEEPSQEPGEDASPNTASSSESSAPSNSD